MFSAYAQPVPGHMTCHQGYGSSVASRQSQDTLMSDISRKLEIILREYMQGKISHQFDDCPWDTVLAGSNSNQLLKYVYRDSQRSRPEQQLTSVRPGEPTIGTVLSVNMLRGSCRIPFLYVDSTPLRHPSQSDYQQYAFLTKTSINPATTLKPVATWLKFNTYCDVEVLNGMDFR